MNTKVPSVYVDPAWVTAESRSLISLLSPYPGCPVTERTDSRTAGWLVHDARFVLTGKLACGHTCKELELWWYQANSSTCGIVWKSTCRPRRKDEPYDPSPSIWGMIMYLRVHIFQQTGGLRNMWCNFYLFTFTWCNFWESLFLSGIVSIATTICKLGGHA